MSTLKKILLALLVFLLLVGLFLWWALRGPEAELTIDETSGTDPILAEPNPENIPTLGVVEVANWADGEAPQPDEGLVVNRFADGLEHPRIVYAMPNGDILVTLTNRPESELSGGAITNFVAGLLFERAGAAAPSPDQLVLLRDGDGDGAADERHVLRDDLMSPSGIAWRDGNLYIANHNALLRFDYEEGAKRLEGEPEKLLDLPSAGNHWMRNILFGADGTKLYVAVGSASNIGEGGMAQEEGRAAIHELDLESGASRIYGAGMRNPNGLAINPWTGELWTTVNERDQLGPDLVPDYMTNVPIGVHYGWPWVYYNDVFDDRVEDRMPQFLTEYTRTPEYALGAHVAALGLVFTQEGARMGEGLGQGAFVARHGSWNRRPPSGYDVVYVAFDERGNPQGKPIPVLTGFLQGDIAKGRPTWLAWDATGALLVSDDVGNIIWRVTAPGAKGAAAPVRNRGKSLPPQRNLDGDPSRAFDDPPESMMEMMSGSQRGAAQP